MKNKLIIPIAGAMTFAAALTFGINAQKPDPIGASLLKNLEVLAQNETETVRKKHHATTQNGETCCYPDDVETNACSASTPVCSES